MPPPPRLPSSLRGDSTDIPLVPEPSSALRELCAKGGRDTCWATGLLAEPRESLRAALVGREEERAVLVAEGGCGELNCGEGLWGMPPGDWDGDGASYARVGVVCSEAGCAL